MTKRQTGRILELEGVEPLPLRRGAVVGMGTMGSGIAQAMIAAGLSVAGIDSAVVDFEFPMSPPALIDMSGPGILVDTPYTPAGALAWHGPVRPAD